MPTNRRFNVLSVPLSQDEPPSEFRLFVAGWNETENGRFLFDAAAAKATMDAFKAWGIDLAIDLEHQMLEQDIAPDPTAKDARGWFQLELRSDGSLWAVNVKWTDDGRARLLEKRQRYVSPAFSVDPETSRVISIINCAITAIPATHDTPALVAARAGASSPVPAARRHGLAVSDVEKVAAALGLKTSAPLGAFLNRIRLSSKKTARRNVGRKPRSTEQAT